MLTIQALRPDRFLASAHLFVSSVFGDDFMHHTERVFDLPNVVENEVLFQVIGIIYQFF